MFATVHDNYRLCIRFLAKSRRFKVALAQRLQYGKGVLYSSKLVPTLPSFLTSSKTRLNNTEFCKLCENSQFLRSSGEYAELAVLSKYGEHTVLELTVMHTVS